MPIRRIMLPESGNILISTMNAPRQANEACSSLEARRRLSRRRPEVKTFFTRLWKEDDGVLSFEWTVLSSLLTVGVVSGVTAVRDATVDEFGDVALSMVSLDQSYYIQPPLVKWVAFRCGRGSLPTSSAGSRFGDTMYYADCGRAPMRVAASQGPSIVEHDWDADGISPVQPGVAAPPADVPTP